MKTPSPDNRPIIPGSPGPAIRSSKHLNERRAAFIENARKVHGDRYDYSKVEYKNAVTKVEILCPEHGSFKQIPHSHTTLKSGCPECGSKRFGHSVLTTEEFVRRARIIHGNRYDYSGVQYRTIRDKVNIICSLHGSFKQEPNAHLSGCGCPSCGHISSSQERLIASWLDTWGVAYVQGDKQTLHPKELDFYLPSHRIAIEVNGLRWHSELYRSKTFHRDKWKQCSDLGIRLINIYEDELNLTADRIKAYLAAQLGLAPKTAARKCTVRDIGVQECNAFLAQWHLLGPVAARIRLGLYESEALVGVMCFNSVSSRRGTRSTASEFELVRACFSKAVVGGSAKLLAAFERQHQPTSITTYSDNDKFTGSGYAKLGFLLDGVVAPDYKTIWGNGKQAYRRSKQSTRRAALARSLPNFDPQLSEHQNCLANRIYRIYDSGKLRWVKKY